MNLENTTLDVFPLELRFTSNFNEIKLYSKPSKKSLILSKGMPNYLYYKIIENKYESITFQNLSIKRFNIITKKEGDIPSLFTYENGIPIFAKIPIYPTISGMDTTTLKSITYPGGLKYYNMIFSKYWSNVINKKIVIIKQIGPKEIVAGELVLYFNEEYFLKKKNTVKTIFCFSRGAGWVGDGDGNEDGDGNGNGDSAQPLWNKINNPNEEFDYEIITDIKDKKIRQYLNCDIVIIDKISIHRKFSCIDDLTVIPTHMVLMHHCIKAMPRNASLIFLQAMPWSEAHIQLFYYIYSTSFNGISYHKSKLSSIKNGYFIFSGFNKTPLAISYLGKAVKQYIKVDKMLGYSLYLPIKKTWCNMQQKMPEGAISDVILTGLYPTNKIIPDTFIKFISKIHKKRKQAEKEYIKKIEYLHSMFLDVKSNWAVQKIQKFILNGIEDSIAYIIKHKLLVNQIYLDHNIVPNPKQLIVTMFPGISDTITKKIVLSRDSIYSVSSYSVAERTSFLIKKHCKGVVNVIDGCSNIGGNTFNFSKNFKFVIANELQESSYENLVNNIEVLQLHNIYAMNADIIMLMNDSAFLKRINFNPDTWVLYLDPPWSGVWYQLQPVINLFLGDKDIIDFIKSSPARNVCLKVPKNYDTGHLFDSFKDIIIYKVEYCYIIIITNILHKKNY